MKAKVQQKLQMSCGSLSTILAHAMDEREQRQQGDDDCRDVEERLAMQRRMVRWRARLTRSVAPLQAARAFEIGAPQAKEEGRKSPPLRQLVRAGARCAGLEPGRREPSIAIPRVRPATKRVLHFNINFGKIYRCAPACGMPLARCR